MSTTDRYCRLCGEKVDMLNTRNGECAKAEDGLHVPYTRSDFTELPPPIVEPPIRDEPDSLLNPKTQTIKDESNHPDYSSHTVRDAVARSGIRLLLNAIGIPNDDLDTKDTPARVVKAFKEMTAGYALDPKEVLGTLFEEEGVDEIVIVRDIPFVSLCMHHLLVFNGTVDVGYIPSKVPDTNKYRIVGLSKIGRVVDMFSQRLQIQEQLTKEIANCLMIEPLQAMGVAVVVRAAHSCMSCRGIKKSGVITVTSSMLGVFRDDVAARHEFLTLCRS